MSPISPGNALEALEAAIACARRGVKGALATVIGRHGSTPSTPGQKIFLGADDTSVGTVGGGSVEQAVLVDLKAMLRDADPHALTRSFKLGAELGMCCGGQVTVLIEPIEPLVPCLIAGGGHVCTALAPLLARLGFSVTVVDEREEWAQAGRLQGVRVVGGEFDEVGRDLPAEGVVLVMTHDHGLDQRVVEWALKRGFAFVGGVGSRAKAQRTRDRLENKGFSESDRARVRMPLGVDIGARTPEEIAVAIAAELVAWRRQRSVAQAR